MFTLLDLPHIWKEKYKDREEPAPCWRLGITNPVTFSQQVNLHSTLKKKM